MRVKVMKISGRDNAKKTTILITLLCTLFVLLPILSNVFHFKSPILMVVLVILVFLFILQGFYYQIQVNSNLLVISRYFGIYRYYEYSFSFEEVTIGKTEEWMKFSNEEEELCIEVENGMEGGTLHIYHKDVELEIGGKNKGKKLIYEIKVGLEHVGIKVR